MMKRGRTKRKPLDVWASNPPEPRRGVPEVRAPGFSFLICLANVSQIPFRGHDIERGLALEMARVPGNELCDVRRPFCQVENEGSQEWHPHSAQIP
jgi:hypothetical protein